MVYVDGKSEIEGGNEFLPHLLGDAGYGFDVESG
jgi:hypothetical protein